MDGFFLRSGVLHLGNALLNRRAAPLLALDSDATEFPLAMRC